MKMWVIRSAVVALALVTTGTAATLRAEMPVDGVSQAQSAATSMKVTVTISRWQGSTETASLPFALWVNADGERASVRMGSDVPVPMTTIQNGLTARTYNYRSLGTTITCSAASAGDGRYKLGIDVSDSQIFKTPEAVPGTENPLAVLQTFQSTNSPILASGQSVEYAVATDKSTGETVKVSVSLEVVR